MFFYPDQNIDILSISGIPYVGHQLIYMPPNWKNTTPTPYTIFIMDEELTPNQYEAFFKQIVLLEAPNPRVFTPRVLEYASLFHPCFFEALINSSKEAITPLNDFISTLKRREITIPFSSSITISNGLHWLQSMVFLSGVTLSAAIIQNRWSSGTIESKLNRLWQASCTIEMTNSKGITKQEIRDFILKMVPYLSKNPLLVLKKLKLFYSKLLTELVKDIPSEQKIMETPKLTPAQKERFGFITDLKKLLDTNLEAVILYGSATNSQQFSDYDLIVVVKNIEDALNVLQGTSPLYNGIELNISVFGTIDFWAYQLASGDNLYDHGICLYGNITVPHKNTNDLLLRNLSFGFIRFRQLMGMGSYVQHITSEDDDKRNLLDYFIKIPLNICKGIEGCVGAVSTNEDIKKWAEETLDFDVQMLKKISRAGDHTKAIAKSTWAAQEVLHYYDQKLNITRQKKQPTENKHLIKIH
ncbi:hypothetical protein [Aquimarina sp. I32.4]|uniref:hypothetical protein n=1 Tax=Aquimarina sp. I32.4 TaxID=2053903 RepID=UPI0011AF017F|nr:hypothetical protein [Aquimarina sp. I32.4]